SLKSGGAALIGARVTPVTRAGVVEGSPATTDATGRFQLVLPAPPIEYALRVGDAPDGGASVAGGPIPAFSDDALGVRVAATASTTIDVDVGALPPPAPLTGRVIDSGGAPVSGARVTATSDSSIGWTLTRSAVADADGAFS